MFECFLSGAAVNQVLMTADGKRVVTMSKDATSRIWDAETGDCLHVLQGVWGRVAAVLRPVRRQERMRSW